MKKKFIIAVAGIAVIAVSAIVTISSVNARSTESDLLTKNLEALTQGEGGSNCDNPSGYAKWETGKKYGFNDCCGNVITGGDPLFGCK